MHIYLYNARTVSKLLDAVSAKLDEKKKTTEEKCTIDTMYIAARVTVSLRKSSESTQP